VQNQLFCLDETKNILEELDVKSDSCDDLLLAYRAEDAQATEDTREKKSCTLAALSI
jgi:hypothetical protein